MADIVDFTEVNESHRVAIFIVALFANKQEQAFADVSVLNIFQAFFDSGRVLFCDCQ